MQEPVASAVSGRAPLDPHPNYVDGEWLFVGDVLTNADPSDFDHPVSSYAVASAADDERAVAAAKAAVLAWPLTEQVGHNRVGHALDADTQVEPVIDDARLQKDLHYMSIAPAAGARPGVRAEVVERPTRPRA